MLKRAFTTTSALPSFLSAHAGRVDVLHAESQDILFNLATEEYMYEHLPLASPVLFLWRNTRTIIIGKHQNPWKECRVQKLNEDGVVLARRKSGGGAVYQDLGNSVFSFLNPITDFQKEDYKTMNNAVLIEALRKLGVQGAEATGRNDICVDGRKVSGSAYKLSLGKRDGSGKKTLHHGTMLLDLDMSALDRYLSPNKAKLQSKGVDSVISRVLNLKERVPDISHEMFSQALAGAFRQRWGDSPANERLLTRHELERIDKLMEIYDGYKRWDWRFGETPSFTNGIERKFDWALVDLALNVEKGLIIGGRCYSDCLVPQFIDELNELLASGQITYDEAGVEEMGRRLGERFQDNEVVRGKFVPELTEWMRGAI